ncbi:dihydroorotase [Psychromonas sp. CD1]|uniref:dihydroorotase n=1 Tax=Psychromonas sp. CD1 TaxID=1979839 RepID=UPI000B9B52B0|nr:dihydroorotase [Psychromonas sp. CD1]
MITLSLTRPDDWHLHLRDGDVLNDTVEDSSRYMGRAIIMPNTVPPICTTDLALAYKKRIMATNPSASFTPLMTLYLTDNTTPEEIRKAKESGFIYAAKLYPAGATTNSDSGVTSTDKIKDVLQTMQTLGMPLLVHGEVTANDVDIFDRENEFLEQVLRPLIKEFPKLKIVLEHITTAEAVKFVNNAGSNVAATITPHHLLFERNDMLVGGIKPHFYCLPILKRKRHQQALIAAATSGSPQFFLGTDSAPHTQQTKESACGCAGSYSAFAPLELYAEVFDNAGALEKLEAFASFYGPDFYELPRNIDKITLQKKAWQVPKELNFGKDKVIPVKAGETLSWQVVI